MIHHVWYWLIHPRWKLCLSSAHLCSGIPIIRQSTPNKWFPGAGFLGAPRIYLIRGFRGYSFHVSTNHFEILREMSGLIQLVVCFVELGPLDSICWTASLASPTYQGIYILQKGVQWKQGVVICMVWYTIWLYDTTPIHCTPLPLHRTHPFSFGGPAAQPHEGSLDAFAKCRCPLHPPVMNNQGSRQTGPGPRRAQLSEGEE